MSKKEHWLEQYEILLKESMDHESPEDDDYVISDSGRLGSGYAVSQGGSSLGDFDEWDEVVTAIKNHMEREQFWPSVWYVNDHGNTSIVNLNEGSSYHRSPKSEQEKAVAAVADKDEEEPKVRAKRNAKNLPDSWDDIPPGRTRSWKKHRKTQYKVKEGSFSFLHSLIEGSVDSMFEDREKELRRLLGELSSLGSMYARVAEKILKKLNESFSSKDVIDMARNHVFKIFEKNDDMSSFREAKDILDRLERFLVNPSVDYSDRADPSVPYNRF